jgi:hypothetical protein
MKKQTISNWKNIVFAPITVLVFLIAGNSLVAAQGKFKPGDRVECDSTESGTFWNKGTVLAFKSGDMFNGYTPNSGYFYRVKLDRYSEIEPEGRFCKSAHMRPLVEATPAENQNAGGTTVNNQPKAENNNRNASQQYKPGDRVECDKAGIDAWEKGTIMPFQKNDRIDGQTYRVRLDAQARAGMYLDGIFCQVQRIRPLAGAQAYQPEKTTVAVGRVTTDADGTLSADRPILDCPVEQTPARNGARPNPEVLKKVLRCGLGEKPAAKGYDGAVTIEITALQVGAPRPWDRLRDMGGGTPGKTIVYPVKVTYSEKTFYRDHTKVGDNWIRIFNFFVNGFGEWQYGSIETIKMPDNKNIPRDQ